MTGGRHTNKLRMPEFDEPECAKPENRSINFMADAYYPGLDERTIHSEEEKARQVCYRCPERFRCLAFAFENEEEYGVWGGMTGTERDTFLLRNRLERSEKDGVKRSGVG